MKLATITDTHYGNSQKTHRIHEKILKTLAQQIKDLNVRAVIHNGDWTSYRQDQFQRTLLMFREFLGDIPILAVRGNHDLWDYHKNPKVRKMQWDVMQATHKQWFADAGIHYLEGNPYVLDDVLICGFDGWYNASFPPTNDDKQMLQYPEGIWCHEFHARRAHKAFEEVLALDTSPYVASIMVTHFPPFADERHGAFCANMNYFEPMKEKFDILTFGHSHQYVDEVQDGTRIINAGSKYDKPNYIIFDVY